MGRRLNRGKSEDLQNIFSIAFEDLAVGNIMLCCCTFGILYFTDKDTGKRRTVSGFSEAWFNHYNESRFGTLGMLSALVNRDTGNGML